MRANFQGQYSPLPPKMYSPPAIPQDRPCYRILEGKGCFLDDRMFFPGDIVLWDEEPNKDMEPLNDLAKQATNEFFDRCDEAARKHSASKGTKYIPNRRPFGEDRDLNSAESRRVELVKGDGGIPVMGARKRGRPKAEKLEVSGIEEKPIADLTRAGKQAVNSVRDSILDN